MINNAKKLAYEIFLIALCVVSFFWLSRIATDQKMIKKSAQTIDEKQTNVMVLTGISAASSFAVSLIPGDAGEAVSEKLADLSGYLMLITVALYVGKWLLAIMGTVAFRIVVPIGCIFLLIDAFFGVPVLKKISWKVMIFSLILFFLVPTSTWLSNRIDAVSDATISERTESLQDNSDEITDSTTESSEGGSLKDKLSNAWSKATGSIKGILTEFQTLLRNMIDTIAAMIVTSVIIPLAVLALALWITNMIFKTSFKIPDMGKVRRDLKADFTGNPKSGIGKKDGIIENEPETVAITAADSANADMKAQRIETKKPGKVN